MKKIYFVFLAIKFLGILSRWSKYWMTWSSLWALSSGLPPCLTPRVTRAVLISSWVKFCWSWSSVLIILNLSIKSSASFCVSFWFRLSSLQLSSLCTFSSCSSFSILLGLIGSLIGRACSSGWIISFCSWREGLGIYEIDD